MNALSERKEYQQIVDSSVAFDLKLLIDSGMRGTETSDARPHMHLDARHSVRPVAGDSHRAVSKGPQIGPGRSPGWFWPVPARNCRSGLDFYQSSLTLR